MLIEKRNSVKILFLQNMHDAVGGITNVNISLGKEFAKNGEEVYLYSLRNGGYLTSFAYPKEFHTKIINSKDEWGCPRYSQAIQQLKKGHVVSFFQHVFQRLLYDYKMQKDFSIMKKEIDKLDPDYIIISHYELFDAIPEKYLCRSISHYHTNFSQLINNKSQVKLFHKYKNKIGKFVWLSEQTAKDAIAFEIENSRCIYNPLTFFCTEPSSLENKKIIFVGRFSTEKRIQLLVELFSKAIEDIRLKDWKLELYGVNADNQELMEFIDRSVNVSFMGETKNPETVLKNSSIFMLTSSFEGFPLVVIEANECGVPCIAFDFGETAGEVIKEETGVLIEQNDKEQYILELKNLMLNEKKRKVMGIHAKKFAQSFKLEQIIKEWYALFDELR